MEKIGGYRRYRRSILSIGQYGENRDIFYLYFDIVGYRRYRRSILSIGEYGKYGNL